MVDLIQQDDPDDFQNDFQIDTQQMIFEQKKMNIFDDFNQLNEETLLKNSESDLDFLCKKIFVYDIKINLSDTIYEVLTKFCITVMKK